MYLLRIAIINIWLLICIAFCRAENLEKTIIIPLVQERTKRDLPKDQVKIDKSSTLDLQQKEDVNRMNQVLYQITEVINYMNFEFFGEIQVGKEQQTFRVIFDIKSSELWLPQDNSFTCHSNSTYSSCANGSCSSSIRELKYEDYSVEGQDTEDVITIGNITTNFHLLAASDCKNQSGFFYDGVLGLGVKKQQGIVKKLFSEKKIEKNIFAFSLSSIDMSQFTQPSESVFDHKSKLIIGGYDLSVGKQKYINYYEVISSDHWAIKLKSVKYGSQNIFESKVKQAIFDTSKPYIYMPQREYEQLKKLIYEDHENKCWSNFSTVCECDSNSIPSKPSLSFTFEDINGYPQTIQILPEYYILNYMGYCVFMIGQSTSPNSTNTWILGTTFMRQTYNIFDFQQNVIGIVNLKDTTQWLQSSQSNRIYFLLCSLLIVAAVLPYNKSRQQPEIQVQQKASEEKVDERKHGDIPLQDIQSLKENLI